MNDIAAPLADTPPAWIGFGTWRDQRLQRLTALGNWLRDSGIEPELWQDALAELEQRLQRDVVQLAFVAEFSRGKSELINAIFFAERGRRLLPAGAGRTTMCPMELTSDRRSPRGLRLLPIETRLQPDTLAQWKARPDAWTAYAFDSDTQADAALAHLCDTLAVPLEQAQALGLYLDEQSPEAIQRNADGSVEIPRWRHALLNVEHPLLDQGVTILDTPGLNAIGAEPELTLSLIPAAHAVVFLLGADTGVTRSDLELWRRHIGAAGRARSFVVLNKIDTLWDPLLDEAQVAAQIERQRESVAATLQLPLQRVFALSAHKALLARIRHDPELLARSGLPALEAALGRVADAERRDLIDGGWRAGLLDTLRRLERHNRQQAQQLDEQLAELRALEGKNRNIVRGLLLRLDNERREFDAGMVRVQALHAVNSRQIERVAALLDPEAHLGELAQARQRLRGALLKTGLRGAVEAACASARAGIDQAEALLEENREMLTAASEQLNTEFAFTAPAPKALKLEGARMELDELERDHQRYLTPARWLQLQNTAHAERMLLSALARLRALLERAGHDARHWNRAALAPLDAQLRERRRNLARRAQSLQQVEQADGDLARRIAQLRAQSDELQTQREQLRRYFEGAIR